MPKIPKSLSHPLMKTKGFSNLKYRRSLQGMVTTMPTPRNPYVFAVTTRRELANIPGDRYVVRVVCSLDASHSVSDGSDLEKQVLVLIAQNNKHNRDLDSLRLDLRQYLRGGGGGGGEPPSSGIFHEPVDENRLSDCIVGVMDAFFHGGDTCTIFDRKYSRIEFCVLVHIFFKYIRILKNTNRKPFSSYLQQKVFAGMSGFTDRTYNTYADKDVFVNFDDKLKHSRVDFQRHADPSAVSGADFLFPAFQEIGWAFQHSKYFGELREIKKTIQSFDL